MFLFNRTIIGHTANVLRFLNFFFLERYPMMVLTNRNMKHVAHCCMALKCVFDVTLCISKQHFALLLSIGKILH